uniref:Uncharacterized protein n=1 Tax=Trichogramma kaykai TaxID=54128 RepID=A0ABD2WT95_9HYME
MSTSNDRSYEYDDNGQVQVKEEPSVTRTSTGDNYVLDLVNSCKVENLETPTLHELSATSVYLQIVSAI